MSRRYSSGILYKHQSALPKLPVPSLSETCKTYLETVKPLVSPQQFQKTCDIVAKFQKDGQMGPVLQKRLEERASSTETSWLIDWWNEYAYMGYRDPVVIYVNYFFAFNDDKKRKDPVKRAASIITGAMQFRDMVMDESLLPDATKQGPLCSEQYKYLFNACRIPAIPNDTTRLSDFIENSHIVVMRKNQFFKVDLVHGNGERLSTAEIENQLAYIYQVAQEIEAPVGSFTTENRDVWTKIRQELLETSDRNKASLDEIERAAFVVCLDDSKPVTKDEISAACWHGDGRNRFFDKSMQFIVFDNGKAGFNGEHSNMEATITHRVCDWVCENLALEKIHHGSTNIKPIDPPKKLNFDLTPKLFTAIGKANEQFDQLAAKHDLRVVCFEGYGKNLIKKFQVSPDAFAQMAIQLAYYKMYGYSKATYESAGTRKFKHGRTETGRSVSVESVEWVKAMQNPLISDEEKGQLGRRAIKAQSAYMALAGDGKGVDRHFLGLRLLLKPGEEKPEVFTDPSFATSCHWNLSTSQVTSEYYCGYGWGEVVPDGYGIAYMVKNDSLQFNLVSQKLGNEYLQHYFHEALWEMKTVFEKTILQKSKL